MAANTKIEWATDTLNFWWGCAKVSPACAHCYAESLAKRWRAGDVEWVPGGLRWLREKAFVEAGALSRKGGRRVFVNSMSDSFEDNPALDVQRAAMLHCLALEAGATWMLLTKRPENVERMVPWSWLNGGWPGHVWIGVTVEDQASADERVPELLRIPAKVRFLSCEPLLGPVDLTRCLPDEPRENGARNSDDTGDVFVDWVIAGGESGPNARPMHPDWARSLRDQCGAARVPFFFKQWGDWGAIAREDQEKGKERLGRLFVCDGGEIVVMDRVGKKRAGRRLDGREWNEVPGV